MYVTRPLSQLLKFPDIVSAFPDGPNSGYLVIQDEESETYSCFGLCKNRTLEFLPFPQNKELTVGYQTRVRPGSGPNSTRTTHDPVFLIPVLNQPLSSNKYYAIVPHKKRKGEAFISSRKEDKTSCCFCRCVKDIKPRPLDPNNTHQQFKIHPHPTVCTPTSYFFAKSVAKGAFPPQFLRQKGWTISTKTPEHFKLDEALGIDSKLRAQLPELNTSIVVGKWYCPFVFVKEGTLRNQMEKSMYYEVTLEQKWEKIFTSQESRGNSVAIDLVIENEEVFIDGNKATWYEKNVVDGVVFFTSNDSLGGQISVGLRREVFERMKWEEERGGWVSREEKRVKINRIEEFKKGRELACYVLVERFNFKRTDGSLAMAYDFKHTHQIKVEWK